MFFDGWAQLARVLALGVVSYAGLVLVLRTSGKRTLAKMNAFDLVVTVALGSTLATALLSTDVALAEALVAFATLAALQAIVAWSSVRWPRIEAIAKAEPRLLLRRGQLLPEAMRAERVSESEILQALRNAGRVSVEEVDAVVLETDGSFSVIAGKGRSESALAGVRGSPGMKRARRASRGR
jgi:uncharacterized membrane protein YcaP (DUF421 family)